MRPLAAAALCAALCAGAAGLRLPAGDRVDFSQHGGDWMKGQCAKRDRQSPIDLFELFRPPLGEFSYFYMDVHSQPMVLENDGRTISWDCTGQGIGGVTMPFTGSPWYNLKRIDLKAMSEHTFRGKHAPLELQLVHQTSTIDDPSYGGDLVIVSVLIDSSDEEMPEHKNPYPGFLQQAPQGSEGGETENDPRIGAEAEDRFVGSLAGVADQAETVELHALAAAPAGAPAGAPAPAEAAAYKPPSPGEAGFNPMLQHFMSERPPTLEEKVMVNLTMADPLKLMTLIAGGTFFVYPGSETLPPCAEKVTWLVKREKVLASKGQIKVLFDAIYATTDGAGNYRTVMPLNTREVEVWGARLREPSAQPASLKPAVGPPVGYDDHRAQVSEPMAKDAITVAKAAQDYAKDLDQRLLRAAEAHAQVLEGTFSTTPAPTTRPFMVRSPFDVQWAGNAIGQMVKAAIEDTAHQEMKAVRDMAASAALGYARQDLLASYGFTSTPPPAPPPSAAPAPAR